METFHPVKNGKISDLVAQQIKKAIWDGIMKPGDRLPPVRRLVEDFKASHVSIREALKNLEASGLILMKPGSGVFVAEPNSQPMGEFISSFLRIHKTSITEVTEARIVLEPSIAKLAAEKIEPQDLLKLELNVQESSGLVVSNLPTHAKFIEFHSLIAEATHNLVINLTMKTLLDSLRGVSLEIADHRPVQVKRAGHVLSNHKKILRALREKQPQDVYEWMLKDILYIQRGFKDLNLSPDQGGGSVK